MKELNVSVITIGDELLIGQTIDTNSAFIGQELNRIGVWVKRRVAVGDSADDIRDALDEESAHSDIIILTGGLGPTADDITKPLLCDYFGGKLVRNEEVLAHVKHLFENVFRRKGPLLDRNVRQADVPDVCEVLFNDRGTAPGMLFKKNGRLFFSLPGVPHEMKGLIRNRVIPYILDSYRFPAIVHRSIVTAGVGESVIAEMLTSFEASLPSYVKLAYLPNYGMVKLRLTARAGTTGDIEKEMDELSEKLKELAGDYYVWDKDEPLEVITGKLLLEKGQTVGTVESCTGGYIAHLLTSVAGSSAYFKGSVVAYANEIKENIIGVSARTLTSYGAVSEETVREMVAGGLKALNTDFVLATSGIMGPSGGTMQKPVGTLWMAVGNRERTDTLQVHLRFDRERNIITAALTALNFFRKFVVSA